MPSPENDRTKAKTTITDDTSADALVTQNKAQVTGHTKFETWKLDVSHLTHVWQFVCFRALFWLKSNA